MAVQGAPRRRWGWWVAGGCALVLMIDVGLGVWGVSTLVHRFQGGSFTCLPADFPTYPGATVKSEVTSTGLQTKECRMVFTSHDAVTKVGPFYESKLQSGDWTETSVEYSAGTIRFVRVSNLHVHGFVRFFQPSGGGTDIEVVLDG